MSDSKDMLDLYYIITPKKANKDGLLKQYLKLMPSRHGIEKHFILQSRPY